METGQQRSIPESTDTLGETLYALRLDGLMYAQSDLTAPWGVDMPPMEGRMMFHIVTQGGCWLRFPNHPAVFLRPGELALMPRERPTLPGLTAKSPRGVFSRKKRGAGVEGSSPER